MLNLPKSAKRRLWVLLAAAVVLAAMVMAGCGGEATTTTGPPTSNSSTTDSTAAASTTTVAVEQPLLRIGAIAGGGLFDSLNPYNAYTAASLAAFMQMYPALAQFSPDLQPKPDLALSWETSPDGLTWTFKLRDDGVWTDGKPITSSDAAFTINTAVKFTAGAAASVSPFVAGIKEATATDPTTLVITLNSPQPALLANLVNLAILPEHVWGPLAVGDGAQLKTLTNDPSKETVVVSGPFTVEKNDPTGTTIFKRVDTFYGEKPLIPGYGLQLFTNPDAAAQALKAGDVDVIFPIPSSLAESLKADPNLQVQATSKMPLMFGLNNSPNYTIHPELLDLRLREAIDIDREQIVSDVYQGYAVPGGSLIYPEYTPKYMSAPLSPVTRDVARANQILDEAGYAKGSDGIRLANGKPMEYTVVLWSARAGDHQRLFDVLKQNLAEIGISLVSEMTDDAWGAFIGYTPPFHSTKDAWFLSFVENPDPDSGLIMFSSTMAEYGISPTGTANPEYDELYAATKNPDPTARIPAVDAAAAWIQDNHAEIALVYWDVLTAWNKQWQNIPDIGCLFTTISYISKDAFVRVAVQE
jgi:peptide/nickel transport system substrate-binding protein